MAQRSEVESTLTDLPEQGLFHDYGPNRLLGSTPARRTDLEAWVLEAEALSR